MFLSAMSPSEKKDHTIPAPFRKILGRFWFRNKITINVPLFKKLRDIIFFLRDNNFLSHVEGHFKGGQDFFDPLKGLSHEIDFKNVDKNIQNLA